MKNLFIPALLTLFTLLSGTTENATAQTPGVLIPETDFSKPKLFGAYPENISVNPDAFSQLFNTPVGNELETFTGKNSQFRFTGEVISVSAQYNIRKITVVVRSTNFPGANLTISRFTGENGSVSYTGLITNKDHSEMYVLYEDSGLFTLKKRNYAKAIFE